MTDLLSKLKAAKLAQEKQAVIESSREADEQAQTEPSSATSNITVLRFALNHKWEPQLFTGLMRCGWLSGDQIQEIQETKVFIHHSLGKAAGKAQWAPIRRILLHPVYVDEFEQKEFQGELKETFFHEVAHFCAFYGGDFKHGPLWQSAMEAFNYQPRRCYNGALYDYKNYKNRKEERFAEMLKKYIKKQKNVEKGTDGGQI